MSGAVDVEPCSLQTFPTCCLDVYLCIVDEEALIGRASRQLDSQPVNSRIGLGEVYFVRDKHMVEKVGTGIAILREASALYFLPVQVVGVRQQVRVQTASTQFLYQVESFFGNVSET